MQEDVASYGIRQEQGQIEGEKRAGMVHNHVSNQITIQI